MVFIGWNAFEGVEFGECLKFKIIIMGNFYRSYPSIVQRSLKHFIIIYNESKEKKKSSCNNITTKQMEADTNIWEGGWGAHNILIEMIHLPKKREGGTSLVINRTTVCTYFEMSIFHGFNLSPWVFVSKRNWTTHFLFFIFLVMYIFLIWKDLMTAFTVLAVLQLWHSIWLSFWMKCICTCFKV